MSFKCKCHETKLAHMSTCLQAYTLLDSVARMALHAVCRSSHVRLHQATLDTLLDESPLQAGMPAASSLQVCCAWHMIDQGRQRVDAPLTVPDPLRSHVDTSITGSCFEFGVRQSLQPALSYVSRCSLMLGLPTACAAGAALALGVRGVTPRPGGCAQPRGQSPERHRVHQRHPCTTAYAADQSVACKR